MANQKISDLTANASPAAEDLLVSVDDPSGTPTTKKITLLSVMSLLNPVGTIREFNVATNPGTLLGFGTWTAYGTGRVTVAIDAGQTEFDTVDETGGAKTHTLTTSEIPSHAHAIHLNGGGGTNQGFSNATDAGSNTTSSPNTDATGGGGAHNNLQPYIVVYRWVRTA